VGNQAPRKQIGIEALGQPQGFAASESTFARFELRSTSEFGASPSLHLFGGSPG